MLSLVTIYRFHEEPNDTEGCSHVRCLLSAQLSDTLCCSCKGSIQRLKKQVGNQVQVCLLSAVSAHVLKSTIAAFIMPADFNSCPSNLAPPPCFQTSGAKKGAVLLPNLGKVGHTFSFFCLLSGLGWLPSLDFPGFPEGLGPAVTPGQSEQLTSLRSASLTQS